MLLVSSLYGRGYRGGCSYPYIRIRFITFIEGIGFAFVHTDPAVIVNEYPETVQRPWRGSGEVYPFTVELAAVAWALEHPIFLEPSGCASKMCAFGMYRIDTLMLPDDPY